MKTADYLRATIMLFKKPRSWIRYTMAKDSDGKTVHPHSPRATCFCLTGGIANASGEQQVACLNLVLLALSQRGWHGGIASWNDYAAKGKQDVIRLLEEAILFADR